MRVLRFLVRGVRAAEVQFVTGFGPIVRDATASRKLYAESLSIPLTEEAGGYLHTEGMRGAKTFALWPLAHAAKRAPVAANRARQAA